MPIKAIHSFLVHPSKHDDSAPAIGGTRVALNAPGRLVEMLDGIYTGAEKECKIDISFDPAPDGSQQNDCRDLVVQYAQYRQMDDGRAIAGRLQSVTTLKSGLGLLFLIVGSEDSGHTKLVISRFPADNGILADQERNGLSVKFLERVFMKKATSYKSVVYSDTSFDAGFWDGRAIDKQVDAGSASISNYWIKEFLASDFRTTSAAGSRRLADALRNATSKTNNIQVKSQLIAAVQLARGLDGKSTSVSDVLDRFGITDEARDLVEQQVQPHLRTEKFRLSVAELDQHAPLRSVELDNEAIVIAPTGKFEQIFQIEKMKGRDDRVRIVTEGKVVNEKLRKSR